MPERASEKKEPGLSVLRVIILVAVALAGLVFSSNYIFHNDKYDTPRFHEINWSPKEITNLLISHALADTNRIDTSGATAKEQRKKHISTLKKIKQWLGTNTDTAVRAALYKNSALFIHVTDLAISSYKYDPKDKNDYVPISPRFMVSYADPGLLNGQISDSVTLQIKRYASNVRFYNKYPGFGLWSLLLIIASVFYFLLIAGFIFHFTSRSANSLFKEHLDYNLRTFFILLGAVLVFEFAFELSLLYSKTPDLSPGIIFMRTLTRVFTLINVSGYLAAAFCLAGMISSVLYMSRLKQKSSGMDTVLVQKLQAEIKRRFNAYFVFAAIILSLAIFTSGVFFGSMNNMEFIKQVSRDQGFSPVNSDMVYLYGILNSFILVLAYLPAKYMLSSLDKSIPSPHTEEAVPGEKSGESKNTFTSGLSKMMANVTDVLVATSPFIASLLQNLLEYIFN